MTLKAPRLSVNHTQLLRPGDHIFLTCKRDDKEGNTGTPVFTFFQDGISYTSASPAPGSYRFVTIDKKAQESDTGIHTCTASIVGGTSGHSNPIALRGEISTLLQTL